MYIIKQQLIAIATMLAVLVVTLILLLFSGRMMRLSGNSGASLLPRIMGMTQAALPVECILDALGIKNGPVQRHNKRVN